MIVSRETQTIIDAIRTIPAEQIDQSKVEIQVRQNNDTGDEYLIVRMLKDDFKKGE